MNAHADHSALIREAEMLKFYRGAIQSLGQRLPADDAALDQLLAEVVATRNELAFTRLVFAALVAGRPVQASHLVQGAALFPDPGLMAEAAWHCTGAVGETLVGAVKEGLMGNERGATALGSRKGTTNATCCGAN